MTEDGLSRMQSKRELTTDNDLKTIAEALPGPHVWAVGDDDTIAAMEHS